MLCSMGVNRFREKCFLEFPLMLIEPEMIAREQLRSLLTADLRG
jgi:hypothetical protein